LQKNLIRLLFSLLRSPPSVLQNVRGLNYGARQDAVRELVRSERLSLVFLQENKLDVINDFDDLQIIGSGFNYFYLPAVHTRGGSGV
jgi:hypothetical protein